MEYKNNGRKAQKYLSSFSSYHHLSRLLFSEKNPDGNELQSFICLTMGFIQCDFSVSLMVNDYYSLYIHSIVCGSVQYSVFTSLTGMLPSTLSTLSGYKLFLLLLSKTGWPWIYHYDPFPLSHSTSTGVIFTLLLTHWR